MDNIKQKIEYHLNKDHFKSGLPSEQIRKINTVAGILLLTLAFTGLFFIFLYLCTNYSQLDELDEYVENYPKNLHNLNFDEINMGVKIMPSYNEVPGNVLFMKHTRNPEKTSIDKSLSLANSYDLNNTYFITNRTNRAFPKLKNSEENIPVGDSITLCLAFFWATSGKGENIELMAPIGSFPPCTSALDGKILWNENDPKTGLDLKVWKQYEYEVNVDDSDGPSYCSRHYNGFYVGGKEKHKCYSYDVIKKICVVVKYDPVREMYNYTRGCYDNGEAYQMEPAEMDKIYYFDGIEIEVRDEADPIIKAAQISDDSYSFGTFWRYIAYLFGFLFYVSLFGLIGICGYLYYKRTQNADNDKIVEKEENKEDDNNEGLEGNLE